MEGKESALATWVCRDGQEQGKSVGLLVCFRLPSPLLLVMLSAWVYGHLSGSIPVVNNQTYNSKIKNQFRTGLLCVTWDGKPGALLFTFTLCLPLQPLPLLHRSAPPRGPRWTLGAEGDDFYSGVFTALDCSSTVWIYILTLWPA